MVLFIKAFIMALLFLATIFFIKSEVHSFIEDKYGKWVALACFLGVPALYIALLCVIW